MKKRHAPPKSDVMGTDALFGSRDIPLEIAEHIFYLAGAGALRSVRCTNKANAEAYGGVGLSLAKRGLWRCHVDSPEMLQLAVQHKLRCLRVVQYIDSLPQVTSLEWLRELFIYLQSSRRTNFSEQLRVFPPRLVTLELRTDLGILELPSLPATLKRLVWDDVPTTPPMVRRLGPLPSSLVHLECSLASSELELPELPPLLVHLDLQFCYLRGGVLPALPATLRHLTVTVCRLTRFPDMLPLHLKHLNCRLNELSALPDLPTSLVHLECYFNFLSSLPRLPRHLKVLWCDEALLDGLDIPQSLETGGVVTRSDEVKPMKWN